MRPVGRGNNVNNLNANTNYNNRAARGMTFLARGRSVKTYRQLWTRLCSWENLVLAYEKAKKRKSSNPKVRAFAEHWPLELALLRRKLRKKTYKPVPLKKFVLRDPKTRTICVSAFHDRVVHHVLVNVLQPVFEPRFIHDSYASRKGRGTLPAVQRFDTFKRKATRNGKLRSSTTSNNDVVGYALKCDVRKYFDTVDHEILVGLIRKKVKDDDVIWLLRVILENYETAPGKGMPLGNWTSQFFANIYLNELNQYIKQKLKAKYYIRYVDDFIILHRSQRQLKERQEQIDAFLRNHLRLELHPEKSKIIPLKKGVSFLGYRVFYHHKLLRQRNVRRIRERLRMLKAATSQGLIPKEHVLNVLSGWAGYAQHANTYRLITRLKERIE